MVPIGSEDPRCRHPGAGLHQRRAMPPAGRALANYTCDDSAAARSQQIVSRLVLGKRLSCLPMGQNYQRVVARCTLPDGRSLPVPRSRLALPCAGIDTGGDMAWARVDDANYRGAAR